MTAELLGLIDYSVNPILTTLLNTKVMAIRMTYRERMIDLIKKAEKQELLDFFTADLDEAIDMSGGTQFNGTVEHLADYLLEHGVIVPPCKVGDTVYVLTSDSITDFEKSRVKRMLLTNLQDGMTIKIIIPCVCDDWGGAVREFYPEDFGKTVFLTQEEAEQALKEGETDD